MNLRFVAALLATAQRASVLSRGAFALQVGFMALNNLLFFAIWQILFLHFDSLNGFRLHDMLALFGVGAAGFGLAAVVCGGTDQLARAIAEGELDALLVQPKSVLLRALCSRSRASGWGDLLSGGLMIWLSGYQHPFAIALAVVLAGIGYAAAGAVMHSLAFWLDHSDQLSRSLFEFVVTFSLYPPSLFGTVVKLVLFTLLPAGLIAYLPIEFVRHPSLGSLLTAVLAVGAYAAFAFWLFQRGLRRYESGSRFTTGG